MSTSEKLVVVTGASSGIGLATVRAFAASGATVVAVARDERALADLVESQRSARDGHGTVIGRPTDVTDHAALDALAADVVRDHGRIDVWVNNAAVNLFGAIEAAPVEMWHRVIEVNLLGTYHGVRAVLPFMREQASGTIINVSSVLGKLPAPFQSAYVASKHAIRAVSDCARQEVSDVPGIEVCTVLPGPIDTPLFQQAANVSGRRIKPIAPVIDASRVADVITSCADRPRREVAVGWSSRANLAAQRIAPATVERVADRLVRRDHFQPAPAPASPGNLWEPDRAHTDVSGGWSRAGRQVGVARAVSKDRTWRPPIEHLDRTGVEGLEMSARSWGTEAHEGRTAVVMVHGLGVASRMCRPTAQRIAAHRPVYAVDLPGFGLSDKPSRVLDVVELSDWLARWVRATTAAPVAVLGVSLGTQVAAELAARHRELCAAAVLVSPIVDPDRRSWRQQLSRWPVEQATQSLRLRGLQLADYAACGPGRVARTFARALHHPIENAVGAMRIPVLVCRGSRDPLGSREWGESLAGRAEHGQFEEIPKAVHAMTHENPVELARVVERFLDELRDQPGHQPGHQPGDRLRDDLVSARR
jgi:NAD(P)-dependent dehydrogenase (short-subunit alcohol dehydrogenase family)/pimeloyl-ACP methyl ester carboxylesterase